MLAYYRKPARGEIGKYLNTAQIMLRFGAAIRISNNQLVRVLKELGFQQERTDNCRFWVMVERTPEEMAQTLPEPIVETLPSKGSTEGDAVSSKDADTAIDAGFMADMFAHPGTDAASTGNAGLDTESGADPVLR
ncbi:MAG: DUF3874 domain-containing protein [Prevotellaceae bacterium]|nr:DUF3874 domain-containing protein [Prevotellaceae bacterium]